MRARCIAYRADGRVCGAPGVVLDEARGGYVCSEHAPTGALRRHAILRAMSRPDLFLAAVLGELLDEDLATELGCRPEVVWRLRLAGWPRADQWATDVARIAAALLTRVGVGADLR